MNCLIWCIGLEECVGDNMIHTSEVKNMIIDALRELDGVIDNKPDQDGNHDLYFVNVQELGGSILAEFETWHGMDKNNICHDKYKITVECIDDRAE